MSREFATAVTIYGMQDHAHPRRRWFQFSLRTLLIGTTLLAISCGWFTQKMKKTIRQHDAVEKICAAQGQIYYTSNHEGSDDSAPRLSHHDLAPSWLEQRLTPEFFRPPLQVWFDGWFKPSVQYEWIAELDDLEHCELNHLSVTDTNLKAIRDLRQLNGLNLAAAHITDDGLQYLADIRRLETLCLDHTQVSNAGVAHLAPLGQLKSLGLTKARVTDAGVPALLQLKHLERLRLDNTELSDAGLDQLSQMSSLVYLSIANTHVTDEGVARFQAARSQCQIVRTER